MLTSMAAAEAVTYGPITMRVPLTVSAPAAQPGTYAITVTCTSPKTATFSGVGQVQTVPIAVSNGHLAYGPGQVPVPLSGGLQSGATVTCTMSVVPPSGATQQYLDALTYDATKMTVQLVLP
jgi:hypothetical protein